MNSYILQQYLKLCCNNGFSTQHFTVERGDKFFVLVCAVVKISMVLR